MKIEEALKLSDIAVTTCGLCVYRLGNTDWYYHDEKARSIYDLAGMYMSTTTWQPAYIRPQFQIGEKVSFLQACLSGQCFSIASRRTWRCIDIVRGVMEYFSCENTSWIMDQPILVGQNTTVTIVADPSQEQPEK